MKKIIVAIADGARCSQRRSPPAPGANAIEIGYQGCTPGYWKNHTGNWEEKKPGDLYGGDLRGRRGPTCTGLDVPRGAVGQGRTGRRRAPPGILARASAAAFLNAAHEGLGYPWRR